MGAPVSGFEAAEEKTAETLLSAFRHMAAAERRKHATVFNYWLSIRRDCELPPIRDLDPLEISDVAPCSVLLELVDGGEDAEIRHIGETLKGGVQIGRLSDDPGPSVLSSISAKLGIVAISRNALAFEDSFPGPDGMTRSCVTLLPFSASGTSVDFVYGLVSVETGAAEDEVAPEDAQVDLEPVAESAPDEADKAPSGGDMPADPVPDEVAAETESPPEVIDDELELPSASAVKPGFSSKVFDALAGAKGFFGTVSPAEPETAPETAPETIAPTEPERVTEAVAEEAEPVVEEAALPAEEDAPIAYNDFEEPAAEDPAQSAEEAVEAAHYPMEGSLQSKLTDVRSKADEARMARLRSEALLLEGLSAAYDFALDAEEAPEEYLKLVEAQGLRIQLRSPMKPVVKLAFGGSCDDATIQELEAVLGWALKMDLPRGSLAERIESEGGLEAVLSGQKRAA